MKTKFSPTIVGAFVIGGFALLVVALLTFGGINFFQKPQRFIVFFDESTQGLDLGSPVKLYGVRIGRVADLNVRYDETKNRSVVAVVCEFNRDIVTDTKGMPLNVADRAELQTLVDRGLRAQLSPQGLATGLLFVELEFFNPQEYPVAEMSLDARYAVVPAVPSAISGFQNSLTEILTNLKKTDFVGISKGVTGLIADTRKQLNSVDLKGVTDQWKQTGAQVGALATGPEIKQTFESLNLAVAELRRAIAKVDAQVEPVGKDLHATLAEAQKAIQGFNEATGAARSFISSHAGIGDEVGETMEHLNDAADAVKRLADFLERNPNALITGRRRPQ